MSSKKTRLDLELVRRKLAPSREKAQALIMAGEVSVDEQQVIQSDKGVFPESLIQVRKRYPYASRAALKLERAIEVFGLQPAGKRILDIGISTGGFSDLVLKRGADSVVGVDVNIRQVDYRLRQNSRLRLVRKNARFLEPPDVQPEPDLVIMDVSFISVRKIIPALKAFRPHDVLVLVKPQFEVERAEVSRGGIVKDREAVVRAVLGIKSFAEENGFHVRGFTRAGIKGKKGNQEYFFWLGYGKRKSINDKMIDDEIEV